MAGFRLEPFLDWDKLIYRASLQLSPDDLLYVIKFARSGSLTATIAEDIWEFGGIRTKLLTAETIDIVSDDVADNPSGTGAGTLTLVGLDSDYNVQIEDVALAGLATVTTTGLFIGSLIRVRVTSVGTAAGNVGTLTLTGSSSATTQAVISPLSSITQQSFITIPAGYTGFVMAPTISSYVGAGGAVQGRGTVVDILAHNPATGVQAQGFAYGIRTDGGAVAHGPRMLTQVPEKSTVWLRATTDTNGTVVVSIQEIVMLKGNFDLLDLSSASGVQGTSTFI